MLKLQPPVKSLETLRTIAAGGRGFFARQAAAEIRRRTLAGLEKAVRPS